MDRWINVDLDGVIYDWHQAMRIAGWSRDIHLPPFKTWEFWNQKDYIEKGITKGFIDNLFYNGVKEERIWALGEPLEGAVKGMWKLDNLGFNIRIVSTRLVHKGLHAQAISNTVSWLDRYSIPYHSLAMIGKNDSKNNYVCFAHIDDSPFNMFSKSFLLDQPWNRDVVVIRRVKSWYEFTDIIEAAV